MNTVVIVASGESLTDADVNYCRDRADVLVINNNYLKAPWARWHYACDRLWWDYYYHDVRAKFFGQLWTSRAADEEPRPYADVHEFSSEDAPGLCREPGKVHQGRTSLFQAINMAFHFCKRRIVLLGADMRGNSHWHGNHPAHLAQFDPRVCLPYFPRLALDLSELGVDVVNCTPDSALTCFRKADLRETI
jgi:hypothetical protein